LIGWLVVKDASVIRKVFAKPALIGAALAVLCGWALWTPLGEGWENASYDSLFRFGHRAVTNQLVIIQMDNESYDSLQQDRNKIWDRSLHADLLNQLTADRARLVVFDVLFKTPDDPAKDEKLAEAMRKNGHVVIAAFVEDGNENDPQIERADIEQPQQLFLDAATNWGLGKAGASTYQLVRQHWPFVAPGEGDFHSLGWVAAQVDRAHFDTNAEHQWLRYYGKNYYGKYGPGERLPYDQALTKSSNYFSGKIVFIGNWPEKPNDPGACEINNDKFRTPYTQQTGKAVGGVEIMATTFLNLVNHDWLRRLPAWCEILLLMLTGTLLGGGLCRLKPQWSLLVAAGIFLVVMLAFVSWSYFSNHWFPWLIIAGGQVPCALAWAWVSHTRTVTHYFERFPGYTPVGEKPFGKGAYGQVWLVRNVIGQFQALKEIERANLNFPDAGPYAREFYGIQSYMPVSGDHPGLLQIYYINCSHANFDDPKGYFYYAMPLGDACDPDWQQKGVDYKPRDLQGACDLAGGRLPVHECVRVGIALLEALDFLHGKNLVHRDIKPSNIIYVKNRPKLADVGLVREAPRDGQEATQVFTPGYEDPLGLGTNLADLYALGKTLYVISTRYKPAPSQEDPEKSFPTVPPGLGDQPDFMRLDAIILKATSREGTAQRYPSAAAMLAALREAQSELDAGQTQKM
jgi:CHASE2 domain-containing sensor protein